MRQVLESLHEPFIELLVTCVGCDLMLCHTLNLPANFEPLSNSFVVGLRHLCHLERCMLAELKAQRMLNEFDNLLLLCRSQELDLQWVCRQWLQRLYEELVHVLEVVILQHIVVVDSHDRPAFLHTHFLGQAVALEEVIHLDWCFPGEDNADRMILKVERVDDFLLILEVDPSLWHLHYWCWCRYWCCCCCNYWWRCCRCWRRRWWACRYWILSRRRCNCRNDRSLFFLCGRLFIVIGVVLIVPVEEEAAQETT
mmetsp:Transcript_3790/g.9657  ORF Transcript_3790/g.9657 Transcript_3790/m.9657 type:complete len:254 (-) Transcript_3790:729-1490(-)